MKPDMPDRLEVQLLFLAVVISVIWLLACLITTPSESAWGAYLISMVVTAGPAAIIALAKEM